MKSNVRSLCLVQGAAQDNKQKDIAANNRRIDIIEEDIQSPRIVGWESVETL